LLLTSLIYRVYFLHDNILAICYMQFFHVDD